MFKSTRKWNTNRHIEIVHKGKAIAFNLNTGKISQQEKPSLKRIKEALIPFPYSSEVNYSNDEFNKIELDLFISKDEQTIHSFYYELLQRTKILENLTSEEKDAIPDQISYLLMYAMMTEDPLYTLDEIIKLKQYKHSKQHVLRYLSKFLKEPLAANIIMENLIKGTRYYKNKNI